MKLLYFLPLILLFGSCTPSVKEKKHQPVKSWEFTRLSKSIESYYILIDDKLNLEGFVKDDSINIYERKEYSESGILESYTFLDLAGDFRYERIYNIDGSFKSELGSIISHTQHFFSKNDKNESIVDLDFAIANPPNTSFNILAYDYIKEAYSISAKQTELKFIQRVTLNDYPEGRHSLKVKITFNDSLLNKTTELIDTVFFRIE